MYIFVPCLGDHDLAPFPILLIFTHGPEYTVVLTSPVVFFQILD